MPNSDMGGSFVQWSMESTRRFKPIKPRAVELTKSSFKRPFTFTPRRISWSPSRIPPIVPLRTNEKTSRYNTTTAFNDESFTRLSYRSKRLEGILREH
mmetsp:Transcript_3153/g.7475  ORF Transcript_3153/g.7475 Transcript_3153/m.7475 type:complete len:98 (+) Transcript_3153:1243-1536(+)